MLLASGGSGSGGVDKKTVMLSQEAYTHRLVDSRHRPGFIIDDWARDATSASKLCPWWVVD